MRIPTRAPLTPDPSLPGRGGGDEGLPCHEVSMLPADVRELVERLLVEGSTFEDVAESVYCGGEPISVQAVENYFRSNLGLQKRRIQWQLETAKALKEALVDPKSGEEELADAVILTGLLGVTRRSNPERWYAVKERLQSENLSLKQQILRLRAQKEVREKSHAHLRMRAERVKLDKAMVELKKLERSLENVQKTRQIDAETLRQIQEVYGLIREPVVVEMNEEDVSTAETQSEK